MCVFDFFLNADGVECWHEHCTDHIWDRTDHHETMRWPFWEWKYLDLTFSFTCSLAIMGNSVIECVQKSCITSSPAECNCFKLFHGFIFHKDILIKSRIGMFRNVKNILPRCLHTSEVLHWVNLFWWRDLCQPDPGHNWSAPHSPTSLPWLTSLTLNSEYTEYLSVAAQGDKRCWWRRLDQTGLQSSLQHSYINMDFCHCF